MLYIDGVSLNKIKDELKNELLNKKIGKITQESSFEITLSFGKINLIISCSHSFPILYISEKKSPSVNENFPFLLSLKKNLSNAQLLDIKQINFDRILLFKFSKLNELGEIKEFNLYFELMGRYSNIILTDSNDIILDLCKKIPIEDSTQRILLSNTHYFPPTFLNKRLPTSITLSEYYKKCDNFSNEFLGVGKLLSNTLDNYKALVDTINAPLSPTLYFKDEKIVLGCVIPNLKPDSFSEMKFFKSFSLMVYEYIESMSLYSAVSKYLLVVTTTLKGRIKKAKKTLINIENDNKEKENFFFYKEIGDILSANLYSLKKNLSSVDLFNFYSNSQITIELNPRETPQKNIENYYKKYNKLKRGIEANKRREIEIKNELQYLESTLDFSLRDSSINNLKNIKTELESLGYIKKENIKKLKNKKTITKLSFGTDFQENEISIIYGRNNTENDYVTFKIATKEDLWFHIQDFPGSHVILQGNIDSISDENLKNQLILRAATLAAKLSKAPHNNKVSVQYTKRRFVTKPSWSKPGLVTFSSHNTITVFKD